MHMYAFNTVNSKNFFFIVENKTFAGRAAEHDATLSTGRPLSVVWFEPVRGSEQGRLKPIIDNAPMGSMQLSLFTPFELMKSAGIHIDLPADTTEKTKEIENEKRFFDYNLVCYMQTRQVVEHGTRWQFEVDDPVDVEDLYVQTLL